MVGLEFELSLIVESTDQRRVGMEGFDMFVVIARIRRCLSAIFADVQFISTTFITVAMRQSVHFSLMRFQTAALSKCLLAFVAFKRTNACMCSGVPLEIEGVVEAFSAERAEIPFQLTVIF